MEQPTALSSGRDARQTADEDDAIITCGCGYAAPVSDYDCEHSAPSHAECTRWHQHQPLRLRDLTGEVTYILAAGGTGTARITSRTRFSDGTDGHPAGEAFKLAWNGASHLRVTQQAIDEGQWQMKQ